MAREDEQTQSVEAPPMTLNTWSHALRPQVEDGTRRTWMPSSWMELLTLSCIIEWVGNTALKTGAGTVEEWLNVSTIETVTTQVQSKGGVPWVEFSSEASLRA